VSDTAAEGTGVDFTSRNNDIVTTTKVAMIEAADVLELPQGQAFALLEGNRRFKLRIPLADTDNDPFIPESLKKVAADMKARYRTSEKWASETDWLGNQPLGANAASAIDTTLAYAGQEPDEDGQVDNAADSNNSGHGKSISQKFEDATVVNGMVGGFE
jgi:hypothetical protein